MAIYITQGNYSEHAVKGMVGHPADWMNAVTGRLKLVGVEVLTTQAAKAAMEKANARFKPVGDQD